MCNKVEVCDGTSAQCPPDQHQGDDGGHTCPSDVVGVINNPTAVPSQAPTSSDSGSSAFYATPSSPAFAGLVVGIVLAALLLTAVAYCCVQRHRARKSETADRAIDHEKRGEVELGLHGSSSAQHAHADISA